MRHVYVDTVVCMVGGGFIWSDHNYASLWSGHLLEGLYGCATWHNRTEKLRFLILYTDFLLYESQKSQILGYVFETIVELVLKIFLRAAVDKTADLWDIQGFSVTYFSYEIIYDKF